MSIELEEIRARLFVMERIAAMLLLNHLLSFRDPSRAAEVLAEKLTKEGWGLEFDDANVSAEYKTVIRELVIAITEQFMKRVLTDVQNCKNGTNCLDEVEKLLDFRRKVKREAGLDESK